MRRILFCTPELAPLNKVGGLGDVSRSLVNALHSKGADVRVLVPGFPAVKAGCSRLRWCMPLLDWHGTPGQLLKASAAGVEAPLYIADFPHHFHRHQTAYGGEAEAPLAVSRHYAAYTRAALQIAGGALSDWQPDVIHCNDWTTGLIPALLRVQGARAATVFTIHNLAHQGLMPRWCFDDLRLPESLWQLDGLEFHGQMSFIKGGLAFAHRLNTVSPTYAAEILSPEFGCGLDGLLRHRQAHISGILNGVDYQVWDPRHDPLLPFRFGASDLRGKDRCKAELRAQLGLAESPAPLVAMVSRLSYQKGIDLVLSESQALLQTGIQLALLGTGDTALESQLAGLAASHPGRMSVTLGYDEVLAHRLIAGADMFLMPSRFEPCGLTQLYSLRYGTVPIAARTGGLVDTVVAQGEPSVTGQPATGFLFTPGSVTALLACLTRAVEIYGSRQWRNLQQAGMAADFSWEESASHYLTLYEAAAADGSACAFTPGPGSTPPGPRDYPDGL